MDDERNPLTRMLALAAVLVGIGGGAWYVLQRPAVKPTVPAPVAVPVAPVAADPATPQYPV